MNSNMSVDQILSQMRSMRAEAKQRLDTPDSAAGVAGAAKPEQPFSALLSQAVGKVNDLQQTSGDLQDRLESGDKNVNLTQVMLASQKASLAFTATVQVRNRLVQAYQDVMNMPL